MSRPSRLWRRLGATSPLLSVTSDNGLSLDDHGILEITMHRGGSEPMGGVEPHTLEFSRPGRDQVRAGGDIRVELTEYARSLIWSRSPVTTAIMPRFRGRIGRQTVDDQPTGFTTKYQAASWAAQLGAVTTEHQLITGWNVSTVIRELTSSAALPQLPAPTFHGRLHDYGYVFDAPEEPVTYSSEITKWTSDIGHYVQVRRNGDMNVYNMMERDSIAADGIATNPTLTRSAALSPATWEQAHENFPRNVGVRWATNSGFKGAIWGPNQDVAGWPEDSHGLEYVRWMNDGEQQPRLLGNALMAQTYEGIYNLPSVTFDMLYLLSSPHQALRDQAAFLLGLEAGQAVYLSQDWNWQLSGVLFAIGIDETITPDSWEITLNLAPSAHVTGVGRTGGIPAQTWDAAGYAWDTETRRWDAA